MGCNRGTDVSAHDHADGVAQFENPCINKTYNDNSCRRGGLDGSGNKRAEQHALDHRIRQLLKRSFQTAAGGFFKTAAKQCHTIKEHCQAA